MCHGSLKIIQRKQGSSKPKAGPVDGAVSNFGLRRPNWHVFPRPLLHVIVAILARQIYRSAIDWLLPNLFSGSSH
jgi:hypothetical protein